MKDVLVVGLGVTGDAVVRHFLAAGARVTVLEDSPAPRDPAYRQRARRAADGGAEIIERLGTTGAAERARGADLVVPSPGVRPGHPAVSAALEAGVVVRSEIDVAAERAAGTPLVAVTGTNGKTTVTTLVAAMLQASGLRAVAAGNIGAPLLDAAGPPPPDVLVAEVSSFQLAFTTPAFRPRVAVLLNLAPDHLDWHGSFDDYAAAKARVFAHQRDDDVLVYAAGDPVVARLATGAAGRRVPFAGGNEAAAAAAARAVGASAEGIAAASRAFEGLPHRLATVAEARGVRWVDDSKATNPHATRYAVEQAGAPVVLIAGGRTKGTDLGVLGAVAPRLRAVVAIGEAAGTVVDIFSRREVPVAPAASMHEAVRLAAAYARPGDVVLLSPACASFDWYSGYAARGDDFARAVGALVREPARGAT